MKPPGTRVPARSFCRGPCSCRRCVRTTERPTKLHARRTGLVASTSSPIGPRSRMLMAKLADGGLFHRSLWRSSRPMARRSAGRINALARLSQFAGNDCRSRATIDEVRQARAMANLTALPASARAPVVLHNHCHGLSAVDSQSRLFSDTRAGHRGFQSAMVRKLARTQCY